MHPFLRHFAPKGPDLIGIERERFLINRESGRIEGGASSLALHLDDERRFAPELSDCQLEDRTDPVLFGDLGPELERNDKKIKEVAAEFGYTTCLMPVAPPDIPLVISTINPRYELVRRKLTDDQFRAASRVAATHFHFGVESPEEAVRLHDAFVEKLPELIQMGDTCAGERLKLYLEVAPYGRNIPLLRTVEGLCRDADEHGWTDDPRMNHRLIRVSPHNATVELRMCDATPNNALVLTWAAAGAKTRDEIRLKSAA